MCEACPVETSHHLFFECTNAREVWSSFHQLVQPHNTVSDTWDASCHQFCRETGKSKSEWIIAFMAVLWSVWRQRNEVIFCHVKMPSWLVVNRAREDAKLWGRYCRNVKRVVYAGLGRREQLIREINQLL